MIGKEIRSKQWDYSVTNMIETLKLVKLAVARRDLVPLQSCFHFYGDRVQGQNGALCFDAPLKLFDGLEVTVHADKFFRAVKLCKGAFNHSFPAAQKMTISKSRFRATIPLHEHGRFPRIDRQTGPSVTSHGLLDVLRTLRPFVSEDASRPWSRSILFKDSYAYATNNVVMAKLPGPLVTQTRVPVGAVDILLELGLEPITLEVSENAILFTFENDMWLKAQLSQDKWPNFEHIIQEAPMEDCPRFFAEAIEHLIPFCEDPKYPLIQLGEFGIATSEGVSEANMDIGDFKQSLFRAEPLLMVARAAHSVAFDSYPKPCYFEGDNGLCGCILGLTPR